MANEWQIESVYAEVLEAPATTTAQLEAAYAEVLAAPATVAGQLESLYVEVLYAFSAVTTAEIDSLYVEVLYALSAPPPSATHVYGTDGLRTVYQLTGSGLVPVDFLTKT